MSEQTQETTALIKDSATRIFSDLCDHALIDAAQEGAWPAELWTCLLYTSDAADE